MASYRSLAEGVICLVLVVTTHVEVKCGEPFQQNEGSFPLFHVYIRKCPIREIPDHATFRRKGINTGLVRQAWGMSLFGPM